MGSASYALIDSEYKMPVPLVLQSPIIMSVAQEMAGALTVSVTFVLNLVIIAIMHLSILGPTTPLPGP